MQLDQNYINKMPKVLLHEHLDGSIRPQTIIDIALENNINLPVYNKYELAKWFIEQSTQKDLNKCLAAFAVSCSVMQDAKSIERIAFEFIEDMHVDGVIYAEVRFCPQLHINNGLSLDGVMEAVINGLNRGKAKFGVEFGILVCGIRNFAANVNFEMARLAHRFLNKGVVGYDFAGADLNFPLVDQIITINYLKEHDIPFTVHTGEAAPCDYILEAIKLGADRLGHCAKIFASEISSINDIDEALNLIKQNNIHVEVNFTSNISTGVSTKEDHPFINLFNQGINVALNTDDRLMFGNSLSSEYQMVSSYYGLSYEDIKSMNINAARSSFASSVTKKYVEDKINKFIG